MKISCIIVDDEPLSRDVLITYISDHPDLMLLGSCKDAFEALNVLESKKVDLLFLDINMPKLSGINFYKSLSNKPEVIFTTAYLEFAIEGFNLNALDYLLKPFSFERFIQAVNKYKSKIVINKDSLSIENFIMLKVDKKMYKIYYDDILFFEALGDYVKVHLKEKVLIVTITLKKLLEDLPETLFLRTHKSYIIAKSKINYIEGNLIKIEGKTARIGQTYRNDVLKDIKN